MKIILDLLTIIIFFVCYKAFDMYTAVAAAMVTYLLSTSYCFIKYRKVDMIQLASLIIVVVLGSLTLLFHNPMFFKIKPTIIYWLFMSGFMLAHRMGNKKPLLRRLLEDKISLNDTSWAKINFSWSMFFMILGIINLIFACYFSTETWVLFKTFGTITLMLIFMVLQSIYLARSTKIAEVNKL